jgi:hypothetical protein
MGLDCSFVKDLGEKTRDGETRLTIGSMVFVQPFSFARDEPFHTFRYSVFASVIMELTGIEVAPADSAPDDSHGWTLEPAEVLEVARRLEAAAATFTAPRKFAGETWERVEIADLARVFRAYGESGYCLATG